MAILPILFAILTPTSLQEEPKTPNLKPTSANIPNYQTPKKNTLFLTVFLLASFLLKMSPKSLPNRPRSSQHAAKVLILGAS